MKSNDLCSLAAQIHITFAPKRTSISTILSMSYFESILQKRGLKECPLPLWKLKITEEEFKELRELLEKRTHVINMENPFITLCKECTLFFAEYWRRLYVDGKHSKQMVYDALESTRHSVNLSVEFYEAARRGARWIKIGLKCQKET